MVLSQQPSDSCEYSKWIGLPLNPGFKQLVSARSIAVMVEHILFRYGLEEYRYGPPPHLFDRPGEKRGLEY